MICKNIYTPFLILFSSSICFSQSALDAYVKQGSTVVTIANANQGIAAPRDLDFNPDASKELWIANMGTYMDGADLVIISNVGKSNQRAESISDGSRMHFMNSTSALSFSDNGNFGTCGEVINSPGDTKEFMGPTLWRTSIYGEVNNNGSSHIDMLHESPYGMGIEAETDNIFWVFDGFNGNICKYNFYTPHGPGEHDHQDGELARYNEVKVLRKNGIPSHLVRDKSSDWLYIVDGGNKRILRMNVKSGQKSTKLECNEGYENGCYLMKNVTWEVYINSGLESPCGIDVKNGRLLVSDNSSGDIIVYDITSSKPLEVGKIKTNPGIMGIKVDEDNKIWFVNNKLNTISRLDLAGPSATETTSTTTRLELFPNPTTGKVSLSIIQNWKVVDALGNQLLNGIGREIDLSNLPNNVYFIHTESKVSRIVKMQ